MGRRVGHVRDGIFGIVEVFRPVAVHEYTSAAEVRLLVVRVAVIIDGVQMVGIAALDGYAVKNDGSCSLRLLALERETLYVHRTDRIGELTRATVVVLVFDRQRSQLGGIGKAGDHVIDVRRLVVVHRVSRQRRALLEFPRLETSRFS